VRFGAVPENPVEWLIARLNAAPRPLLETQMAFTLARLIMVGTKVGVFDAVSEGAATPDQVASRCGTSVVGMEKLLFALAGAGYLRASDGGYALTPVSRKWLLRDSPDSVADKLLFQFLEWDWMERAEEYVRTGQPLELHDSDLGVKGWDLYQRGMRAMANAFAGEAVRRMPVPRGARRMLDIGGSHGYYSVALCRRHDGLRSEILDLPEAIEQAAPLLATEGMGDRVVHRGGDALTTELESEAFDPHPRRPARPSLQRGAEPPAREEGGGVAARGRRLRGARYVPAANGEGGGAGWCAVRVLLRAYQPVGDVGGRGDRRVAAAGGSRAPQTNPLQDGSRGGDPGGRESGLARQHSPIIGDKGPREAVTP
jgi:hypothetical protein